MVKGADWLVRIDALSLKERSLVLAATLLTLLMGWDHWLMQPLDHARAKLQNDVVALDRTLKETEIMAGSVISSGNVDPDAAVRASVARDRAELATFESEIEAKIGRMVPPEQMAQVLESVLTQFDKLQFLGLEGLGVEPLIAAVEETAKTAAGAASPAETTDKRAYRHGIRIRFSGSYLDAVAYLRVLEKLPWGFFWDRIELEAGEYPRAEGSIVVYTLSLDRAWIGV